MPEKSEILKNFRKKFNLLTILGPTAGGKTGFAAYVACQLNAEILSADSRQVYRGMDIGTGKDLDDYIVNGKQIPYHLIDIADAGEKYNLFRYQKDFFTAYEDIVSRGKLPLMCGGTGLYIDAIVRNYKLVEVQPNPELRQELEQKSLDELAEILASLKKLHNTTEIDTKKRAIRAIEIELYLQKNPDKRPDFPEIKSLNIGVKFDRTSQKRRITERLKQRLENGMIDEVKRLIDSGVDVGTLIYYGLEYKFVTLYLTSKISYDEMFRKLEIAIHQFSKRQMTFFRRMERLGQKIYWLDGYLPTEKKFERLIEIIEKETKL